MRKFKIKSVAFMLAACLVFSSFSDVILNLGLSVFAAGEHNYIANDGENATETVAVQTGGSEYVEVSKINDATAYGTSIGLTPKASGANNYWTHINIPKQDGWRLNKTYGIAMYVKIPAGISEASVKTMLYLDDTAYFSDMAEEARIYYLPKNSADAECVMVAQGTYPLKDKQGFEGFVFIPYTSLSNNGAAPTPAKVNEAANAQLRLAVVSSDVNDYNNSWVFDEIGYYEGIESYLREVEANYSTEYVLNSGEDAVNTTALQWNCKNDEIVVGQIDDSSKPYGKAIGLTTGDINSGWNNYKTAIKLSVPDNAKTSETTGFAFYVELPAVDSDTALDIWWYINDETFWPELKPGEKIYYVKDGTDKLTSTTFSWNDYTLPGHNMAGYKGFIFVPFSSLKYKYSGTDRSLIDSAASFELRIGIARKPDDEPELAGQTFVFDEVGLYTDPLSYIETAKHTSSVGQYEFIVNDGSDVENNVKLPPNYTEVTVSQQGEDYSRYGESIKYTTGASGWNANKTGIVLNAEDVELDMTEGIAFYANVPDVGALDTALDVWLWNTDRYTWNELKQGSPIYYIEQGSNEIKTELFSWGDYSLPLHNKSGWEGFVFIPFSTFKCTWNDNKGQDRELINSMKSFELRFNVARTDAGLGNKTFTFDEFGFYRDPFAYINAAQKHLSKVKVAETVANNCDNVSDTVVVPSGIAGGKVVVSQLESGITPYGKALSMTLGSSGWNNGKLEVSLTKASDYDITSAEGFAFYAKVPIIPEGADPAIDIMFYINDQCYWHELKPGEPIYYLPTGASAATSEIFSWGDFTLPLHNRSGFEGFVFIPFSSLNEKYGGTDRDKINAASNFQVRFNVTKTDAALANSTYIFDEFGFYSDPVKYAEFALTTDGADVAGLEYLSNSGESLSDGFVGSATDALSVNLIDNASNMGMAYSIFPSKEGANNYWANFNMPKKSSDWDLTRTEGVAFYAKIPADINSSAMQVMLYIDDNHYYNDPVNNAPVYYVPKGSDKVTTEKLSGGNYPLNNKIGFEGWVFVPYSSLQKNGETATPGDVAKASSVQVRMSIISTDTANYSKDYVIDELGFYSDPLAYVKYVKSFYVDTTANYIANDGSNAAEKVIAQWDMTNQIEISQGKQGDSPYGASISLINKVPGFNLYKSGIVMDVEDDWRMEETNGIGFYIKIPKSDADPALDMLLFINNTDYWHDTQSDKKIYYLEDGSDTLTEDYASNLIGHNMQGFSGFVFFPYEAFRGMSGKREIINNAKRFEWRLNTAQTDRSLIDKQYIIDEVGFYSDPMAYAEKVKELHSEYEYVANNGGDASSVKVQTGRENTVKTEIVTRRQPFGGAIAITPTEAGWNEAWTEITLQRSSGWNMTKTNGVAFYAKLPKDIISTQAQLMLYVDDSNFYVNPKSGENIYYLAKGADSLESSPAVSGFLNGKQDFEGWVFVPYSAWENADGEAAREIINNASSWQIRTSICTTDASALGSSFIFDELGFYSDPFAYARPIKSKDVNFTAESFDDLSRVTPAKDTKLQLVSDKTPFGNAVSIIPTKVRADNQWERIAISKSTQHDISETEGIAMYVRMPGSVAETQLSIMLYFNDNDFFPNVTGPIYYMPKNSDGTVMSTSARQPLYDKVAFEGWMFIPYTSLTAHDGRKVDINQLSSSDNFQIRISHYRQYEAELNKNFIFDEIGFYSDMLTYAEKVRAEYNVEMPTSSDGNYIANDGTDIDLTTVERNGLEASAFTVDNKNSPYGGAYAMADSSDIAEWHSLNAGYVLDQQSSAAAENATGIAFYAKLPENVGSTGSLITLYADMQNQWTLAGGINPDDSSKFTADYVTVDMNGNRKAVNAEKALENLQGFEGYIFIPFTSFRNSDDASVNAASSLDLIGNSRTELRILYEWSSLDQNNRRYIIDEIGFYSSEDEYIRLVKKHTNQADCDLSGNAIINSCSNNAEASSTDSSQLKVDTESELTSTGKAVTAISLTEGNSVAAVDFKLNTDNFAVRMAKGVAAFIIAPADAELTFTIKVNEHLSYTAVKKVTAGTEKLIYVPFADFKNSEGMATDLDMSLTYSLLIAQGVSSDGIDKKFVYDSVGFYSSKEEYAELVANSFDANDPEIGNYPYLFLNKNDDGVAADNDIKTDITKDTSWGDGALKVTAKSKFPSKLKLSFTRGEKELWQISSGVAMFVSIPQNGAEISSISFDAGGQSYKLSGEFKLAAIDNEYDEPVTATSLSALGGYTGWVFAPFTSFGGGLDSFKLSAFNEATITLNVRGEDKELYISSVGLYSGYTQYMWVVRKELGYGNFILNTADNLNTWKNESEGSRVVSIIGKSLNGKAAAFVPLTKDVKHSVSVTLSGDGDFSKTTGLAYYFNTPEWRSADMTFRLIIDDNEYWEYTSGRPINYTYSDAESLFVKRGNAVNEGLSGNKGWGFIPFTSMSSFKDGDAGVAVTGSMLEAIKGKKKLTLVMEYVRNAEDIKYEYIFDTVGIYSDINEYLNLALADSDVVYAANADFAAYIPDYASGSLYTANTMASSDDVSVSGAEASFSSAGVTLTANGSSYSATAENALNGNKAMKTAEGIVIKLDTTKDVNNSKLSVSLKNTLHSTVEEYVFGGKDFYYHSPSEGKRLVKVNGEILLPEFNGYLIIPFASFALKSGRADEKLSPEAISEITVSAVGASGSKLSIGEISYYSDFEYLEMLYGGVAPRYTITAADVNDKSIAVSGNVVSIHDKAALKYSDVLSRLTVVPASYSLALADNSSINSNASSSFRINVVKSGVVVGTATVKLVTKDIVADERVVEVEGVEAVEEQIITKTETYVIEKEDPEDDEKTVTVALIGVKKSASTLVKLGEYGIEVDKLLASGRLLTAFNFIEGSEATIVDTEGNKVPDNAGVYNGYKLKLSYEGKDYEFTIFAPEKGEVSTGPSALAVILIIAAAVLVIAAVIIVLIIVKRRKRN